MKSKKEIKLDFFKQFGNESFRGYPLEQCHAIWEFFEKYIQLKGEDIQSLIDIYNLEIIELEEEFRDSCSVLTLEKIATLQRVVTNLESKIEKLGDDESNEVSLIDKINDLQNKHSNDYEFGQETRKLLKTLNKTK